MESIVLKERLNFSEETSSALEKEFLEYYLIKNVDDYGIKVVKKCDDDSFFYEEVFCFKSLGSVDRANEIIEILARNKVTPIGADEIISDLLSEN